MEGDAVKDGGDLRPLSSLDLVDSFINIDDHLDSYLKNLQPGLDSQFGVPDHAAMGMPYWGQPGQQHFMTHEELFPMSSGMQGCLGQQPGLVTSGGDPGFIFQAKQEGDQIPKTQAESGEPVIQFSLLASRLADTCSTCTGSQPLCPLLGSMYVAQTYITLLSVGRDLGMICDADLVLLASAEKMLIFLITN